ncbi:5-oxoprolinase subunit C family protein [Psychrobacillus sp. FSL K6-1267]|uniref:5-oxoprolinase subunit C family protein n=1 Tax=Psychrobacillus sp. FSL K6-1267 TaxID=2921543 RepID=UPI0030F85BF9
MKALFKVIKEGVYASYQDLGRTGYRKFGMPVAGAMDKFAFQIGNKIMNNSPNSLTLEIFLGGISLEVLDTHKIVICGADLEAALDGKPITLWKSFSVFKGQVLTFKGPRGGSIAYIIPVGGFCADTVMNSKSAYPRADIGGLLKPGMILFVPDIPYSKVQTGLIPSFIPNYEKEVTVNVWKSPHLSLFKPKSIETFLDSAYIYKAGDRMGYYIEGPELEFVSNGDILSEATQFGTIQVSNNGQPVILMADAQTVGGYATIGKIAEEDLWKVSQLKIGGIIHFQWII